MRVVDDIVVQDPSTGTSFFASTTLLIVGGLLALLGSLQQTSALALPIASAIAIGSAGVVWVLFMREFHAESLALMRR